MVETTFKSVDAEVAGQWEFPDVTPAPLVLFVPASTGVDRYGLPPGFADNPEIGIYEQLAKKLLAAGFAVFRYDQPGTGRSGRGNFATARSTALEAYRRAVDHARVDPSRAFILGHSAGTDAVAGIFTRYDQINPLAGTILMSNQVGETEIVRVSCDTLVVVTDKNPDDRYQFGEFVSQARGRTLGEEKTTLALIPNAEASLLTPIEDGDKRYYSFDPKAVSAVIEWLSERRTVSSKT